MAFIYNCLLSILLLIVASDAHEQDPNVNQDLSSLLSFKASADPLDRVLHTWDGRNPCSGSWIGIKCHRRRIIAVYLDGASLVGDVSPLFGLSQLQVLSLRRNALAGPLPPLTNLTNPRLELLFLSHNQLNGTLNISLPYLRSLRVENNEFSGVLTGVHLPAVEDFSVSENNFSGEIPAVLSKFPGLAFASNDPSLCGSPLPTCNRISKLSNSTTISPSSTLPSATKNPIGTMNKVSLAMFLAIGLGDILVISVALATIVLLYFWLRKKLVITLNSTTRTEDYSNELDQEHIHEEIKEKERGLVCFEGGEDLRLECLLKASAEVLGKGISGSTYKAVLDDGIIVAVKRLSAVQFASHHSKAFDKHMHLIGKVRHPNVVCLRAYCNAHEEKLLVYDYMPNGSLHSLLQNNSGETNLDWVTRKQILMGAAQGLNFIHTFPARSPLVHANIKPSNVLIDEQGNACLAEWGIMSMATNFHQSLMMPYASNFFSERMAFPAAGTVNRRGYVAPELFNGKEKATQESDVYSFGMVLLEIVTDKEVEERECEGEIMGMVKIGMMCTAECPEERPKMSQVLRMLSDFSKERICRGP